MGVEPRKVLVIASLAYSLVNFRGQLLARMVRNGHDVVAVAPEFDAQIVSDLAAMGVRHAEIRMDRTGLGPLDDLRTFRDIRAAIVRERPDVVLVYTIKPTVYGGLATRLSRGIALHALFTGMGYAFAEEHPTGRRRLARAVVVALHRLALKRLRKGFVYNDADMADLKRFRMVPPTADVMRVPGSGVDTVRFAPPEVPPETNRVLFIGRLLRSKGVPELVEAAKVLRARGVDFTLDVVGPEDPNPDRIDPEVLTAWQADGLVTYHGATRDVRPYLREASVFVLPTMYREGTPRTILEAMAMGVPVVTTNSPVTRDAIRDGETGLLADPGDIAGLADAIERILTEDGLRDRFSKAARAFAVDVHSVDIVNRTLLTEMGLEAAD